MYICVIGGDVVRQVQTIGARTASKLALLGEWTETFKIVLDTYRNASWIVGISDSRVDGGGGE
jgi:hypothetical protein